MTFPFDYHSKVDLRLEMMFTVETRNRNPNVHKHDLRHSTKIKDDICNSKLYIMINARQREGGLMGGKVPCRNIFVLSGLCFPKIKIMC